MLSNLSNLLYNYDLESSDKIKDDIIKALKDSSMAPLYSSLCQKYNWELDQEFLNTMKYLEEISYYSRIAD
jgi:hypothetical protein